MKKILSILLMISLILFLTGCFSEDSYKIKISTTDDGIIYYKHSGIYNTKNSNFLNLLGTAHIVQIEDKEEVIIPEYIKGRKVTQLGADGFKFCINSIIRNYNTKRITVKHEFNVFLNNKYYAEEEYYVFFPNLETLTYLDYIYCNLTTKKEELTIPWYLGEPTKQKAEVILRKTDRKYNCDNFTPKVINIPEYVTTIEKGVFDNLKNVIIKTSYIEKPVGWEEGWNGDCEVIWGAELKQREGYYRSITEDGLEYLNDCGEITIERIWDIGLNKEHYIIPEYIDGIKVWGFDDRFTISSRNFEYGNEKIVYPSSLTIQSNNDVGEYYFTGGYNPKIIYLDYLYCEIPNFSDKLLVTYSDCKNTFDPDYYYPTIELRKTNREYSLDEFNPKEIIILDNVTVIEKGVFDGLTDVVIKTSYKEKPEGWEEGWNGDCEVIWGVEFEVSIRGATELITNEE